MTRLANPRSAMAFVVFSFILYVGLAFVLPAVILRDIANSIALGVSVLATLTWARGLTEGFKANEKDTGEVIAFAIFLIWLLVSLFRVYAIAYNSLGRPSWVVTSPISGVWPWMFACVGILFVAMPGVRSSGMTKRTFWSIILGVAGGALLAGFMIGISVSTEIF